MVVLGSFHTDRSNQKNALFKTQELQLAKILSDDHIIARPASSPLGDRVYGLSTVASAFKRFGTSSGVLPKSC
jgi:hypothetical protein